MRSKRTAGFKRLMASLPLEVKRQTYSAYRLFKRNPQHPSLHFKRVGLRTAIYSVRIGIDHRALGRREDDDMIIWFWIGTHAEYDKLLGRACKLQPNQNSS